MIIGIGIDMVKISKLETALKKWGQAFLDKVFNPEELAPLPKGKTYLQRLAARFAVKEAVFKAVSKKCAVNLKDIIVLNKKDGAPYCKFKKNLKVEVLISLSHIEEYAVACAVAQKKFE